MGHTNYWTRKPYQADFILALTVESNNGVRNRNAVAGAVRDADPDFLRALDLLREVQAAGVVGLRVEEDKTKGSTAVLFFQREAVPEEILRKSADIRRLLKLAPGQQRFVITYSPVPGAGNELAVNGRSMLQIMMAFSSYVDVPAEELRQHLALPALGIAPSASSFDQVHIHSGQDRSAGTYAAVYYHDHWSGSIRTTGEPSEPCWQ